MQCLPLAVSTVKQVTQQSEYIFQVLVLSKGVAQTYESVELWVVIRRALKVLVFRCEREFCSRNFIGK